jgi:hypothetical protein
MSTSETSQSTHLHVGIAKDQVNGNFQGLRLEVVERKVGLKG